MGRHHHNALLLITLLIVVVLITGASTKKGPDTGPEKPAYVGSETCQPCHEDIYNAFAKSPHDKVEVTPKPGYQGKGCEACHGMGSLHAGSGDATLIRNPARLTAPTVDQICLKCHLNQPEHIGRPQSSHARNSVSCFACHKIHAKGPNGLIARKANEINELCAGCHRNVWAAFQKPNHHRLPEGAMSCVDCHNPHGDIRPAMSRQVNSNEPACFRCHGDKRGPFTFEHAPVRFEGCTSCHDPHGSLNPRMLTRNRVSQICLECHSNLPDSIPTNAPGGVTPPAFHNLNLVRFQNCTICHQKVHGSYVDRNLLR